MQPVMLGQQHLSQICTLIRFGCLGMLANHYRLCHMPMCRSRTPQPDKRIMVEDVPVSLGEKYRAPDTKNQVQFDDAQLQLGSKYRTQGRNE